jgi:hypothetical protein
LDRVVNSFLKIFQRAASFGGLAAAARPDGMMRKQKGSHQGTMHLFRWLDTGAACAATEGSSQSQKQTTKTRMIDDTTAGMP